MALKCRTVHDDYSNKDSAKYGLDCGTEGGAQQHFKDECDVNVILERCARGGFAPPQGPQPMYGDFTEVGDYHSALNAVLAAEEAFMGLDAKIRARFDNDPGMLLQFLQDPANRKEAVELGLVDKKEGAGSQPPGAPPAGAAAAAPASPAPAPGA